MFRSALRVGMILFFAFFLLMVQINDGQAQETDVCPVLVQAVVERVQEVCSGTGRNQICYGHSLLEAEANAPVSTALLTAPGDIAEIENLSSLRLFPMNVELEQWGVALMRVQANLPATLPGQNVLFVLFGDVELTPEPPTELVSNRSQNTGAINAFRLHSGIGEPECDTAPPDGLLIQTPHGTQRVELTINGVDFSLGSTVFVQASENGYMTVSTLEGSALLTVAGVQSLALAGTQVRIRMNENLEPASPPSLPHDYPEEIIEELPISILDRPIEIHPPLEGDELENLQRAVLRGEASTLLEESIVTELPTPDCDDCITPTEDRDDEATNAGGNQSNSGGNSNGNSSTPATSGSSGNSQPSATSSGINNGGGQVSTPDPTEPPLPAPTIPPVIPTNPPPPATEAPPLPTEPPQTEVPPAPPERTPDGRLTAVDPLPATALVGS